MTSPCRTSSGAQLEEGGSDHVSLPDPDDKRILSVYSIVGVCSGLALGSLRIYFTSYDCYRLDR